MRSRSACLFLAAAVLLSTKAVAQEANPEPKYTAHRILKISGAPKFVGKNHWAVIIISQFYDASTEQPVSFSPKDSNAKASAILLTSQTEKITGGNELSYRLEVYQVDFLDDVTEFVCKRADFQNLPAGYLSSDFDPSDPNASDCVLRFKRSVAPKGAP